MPELPDSKRKDLHQGTPFSLVVVPVIKVPVDGRENRLNQRRALLDLRQCGKVEDAPRSAGDQRQV